MDARCTKCMRRHKGLGTICQSCLESYCWSCWNADVEGREVTCEACRAEARKRIEQRGRRAGRDHSSTD